MPNVASPETPSQQASEQFFNPSEDIDNTTWTAIDDELDKVKAEDGPEDRGAGLAHLAARETLMGTKPELSETDIAAMHEQADAYRQEIKAGHQPDQPRGHMDTVHDSFNKHVANMATVGEDPKLTEQETTQLQEQLADKRNSWGQFAKHAGRLNILGIKPPYKEGDVNGMHATIQEMSDKRAHPKMILSMASDMSLAGRPAELLPKDIDAIKKSFEHTKYSNEGLDMAEEGAQLSVISAKDINRTPDGIEVKHET